MSSGHSAFAFDARYFSPWARSKYASTDTGNVITLSWAGI
jgi:hypothetical protein